MDGPQEVAADTKEILDGSVHREKPLRVGGGFEPTHLTLALPRRLMREFHPVSYPFSSRSIPFLITCAPTPASKPSSAA